MMVRNYALLIAKELDLAEEQVKNTLALLEGGATIPFISRYRKEATGSLNEVQIGQIKEMHTRFVELDKRRAAILDSLREQEKLTLELESKINAAETMSELEDLYLPYRPKRKTRASVAVEKGLAPLAKILSAQQQIDMHKTASRFVNAEKGVQTVEEALAGARDILAERISENISVRARLRSIFRQHSRMTTKLIKDKVDEGEKYRMYYDTRELLAKAPSHRVLAVLRGEEEGILRLTIAPDEAMTLAMLKRSIIKNDTNAAQQVWMATQDAYKRLLQPQMETEMRKFYKDKADTEAIDVFARNLRQLLMAAPLGQVTTLALDPGFRTGCKVVVLDREGNLLHHDVIYPHPPKSQFIDAMNKVEGLIRKFQIEAISIGNGTASRETEEFVKGLDLQGATVFVVSEDGASIYSASKVAREEFPDEDVTVRGAVSIGRRLMDPLAELVKIDPKAIGVGQYQHDCPQKRLDETLGGVVEDCVNAVGVDVNTASASLLGRVSGLNGTTAKNIVKYREENGAFTTRKQLLKVPKLGPKAFEQCAGFLRVPESKSVLDHTGVHPESYAAAEKLLALCGYTLKDVLAGEIALLPQKVKLLGEEKVAAEIGVGVPTLRDVVKELTKPGRDVRDDLPAPILRTDVLDIKDLKPGLVLNGTVRNVVDFGVFVDIGVHQDGLVHISQVCNKFIKHPSEVVSVGDIVKVVVLEVDEKKHRIGLSMKQA